MSEQTALPSPEVKGSIAPLPYPPGWIDRAIGFFVPAYGSVILSPRDSGTGAVIQIASMLPAPLLAIVYFLWPLLGIHRLLEAEKVRLVDANQTLLEDVFQRIETCARTEQLDDIERLSQLMASLQPKDRILKQISTWPWQPEALRSVIATVLLPILSWLAQQVLQRFLPT